MNKNQQFHNKKNKKFTNIKYTEPKKSNEAKGIEQFKNKKKDLTDECDNITEMFLKQLESTS